MPPWTPCLHTAESLCTVWHFPRGLTLALEMEDYFICCKATMSSSLSHSKRSHQLPVSLCCLPGMRSPTLSFSGGLSSKSQLQSLSWGHQAAPFQEDKQAAASAVSHTTSATKGAHSRAPGVGQDISPQQEPHSVPQTLLAPRNCPHLCQIGGMPSPSTGSSAGRASRGAGRGKPQGWRSPTAHSAVTIPPPCPGECPLPAQPVQEGR